MTSTLNAPVFEVKQDSEWYKYTKARLERETNFFKELNGTFFEDNGFAYYHGEHFGVTGSSKDYEKYKDEVLKNPDKNGVYIFRKRSKYTAIFIEMMKGIDDENPFKAHDVFGRNNLTASQWVGGRWFFGVKDAEKVKGTEVEQFDYKLYLKIMMDSIT